MIHSSTARHIKTCSYNILQLQTHVGHITVSQSTFQHTLISRLWSRHNKLSSTVLYTTAYRKCAWSLNDLFGPLWFFSYICGNLPAVLAAERNWHYIVSNQREMYFMVKNTCNTGALLRLHCLHITYRLSLYHLTYVPAVSTTYLFPLYIQWPPISNYLAQRRLAHIVH